MAEERSGGGGVQTKNMVAAQIKKDTLASLLAALRNQTPEYRRGANQSRKGI